MDTTKIVAEIADGRHDGNLADVLAAVRSRVEAGATAFLWKIEWDGLVVTEEDVTVGELALAEEIAGRNWSQLNPNVSASNLRAILTAALASRRKLDRTAAQKLVEGLTVHAMLDCLSQYEVAPAPFEDSPGPPTTS